MNKKYLLVSLVLCFCSMISIQAQKQPVSKVKYVSHQLVVKLLPSHRHFLDANSSLKGIISINRVFPNQLALDKPSGQEVDLSLVYVLGINSQTILSQFINELKALEVFEYVERKVIHDISFHPNDPEIGKQSYLSQINAYSAWDVTQGSPSVKIGIVDSGTDMDHPDLQNEMYANIGDPINGVDDDNDGYIDNYWGWDFYENDNNPQIGDNDHGVHVAGIAAATTDNNEGVASIGFRTKFVPIRAGNGTVISAGFEGIVYAADLGCDIVNCSWGSQGFSEFGQDVVNYATFNKNTLVVAASGNNGLEVNFYPAAYQNVLAVGSVTPTDVLSSFTNYGYFVDILAPGQTIYSTVNEGNYNYNTGTSMAAPVVSGAAALVKSVYPQLTAMQLAQRLKTTSFNMSSSNPAFENKMGSGRLDVLAAVSGNIINPSIVFSDKQITNNGDDVFKAGDTLSISGKFTNYLAASANVEVTISSNSLRVVPLINGFSAGAMGTFTQTDNYLHPFVFSVDPLIGKNTLVVFEMEIDDGVSVTKSAFEVFVNVDYLNVTINNLKTSVGSKGQFGYNTRDQSQGLGIDFMGEGSQLFEGGLMIGTDNDNFTRVMDRVRNDDNWEDDFQVIQSVEEIIPANQGQYEVFGVFNDANAQANRIGIKVTQNTYASSDQGHENYVVLEYTIVNTSGDSLKNVNVGLFADFDIGNYDENQSFTDLSKFMTYSVGTAPGSMLFGVQLLSQGDFRSYCLDNIQGGAGGIDISSGFSNFDKFMTLSTNRYVAGFTVNGGNDVVQVTAVAGLNVSAGDSISVAFALIAAESRELLDQVADSAYFRYNNVLPNAIKEWVSNPIKIELFPNPAKDRLMLKVKRRDNRISWSFRVMDASGKELLSSVEVGSENYELNVSGWKKGVYMIDIQAVEGSRVVKFIKN